MNKHGYERINRNIFLASDIENGNIEKYSYLDDLFGEDHKNAVEKDTKNSILKKIGFRMIYRSRYPILGFETLHFVMDKDMQKNPTLKARYPLCNYSQINIFPVADEWYYIVVADSNTQFYVGSSYVYEHAEKMTYWKCDQFDSVLSCLKNEYGVI